MKTLEGCRKLFVGVEWPENQLNCTPKKNLKTKLFLPILCLELPPMAQKPAFLTYFMIFFLKNSLTKLFLVVGRGGSRQF